MAENKNLSYNEIPNKNEDWGLDPRNGLKYSGESVQKYIKDELQNRMGTLYYDEGNERYLAFADNDDKETYLADPTNNAALVLATWNAPANYTAEINVTTSPTNYIHEDEKGNYIEFTFDIKNRSGASTGDSVICTYVITNGGKKQEVIATYTAGTQVQFLVDSYLSQGTNNIVVKIQGQSTYAATQASVSYVISDLVVTSDFNFQNVVPSEVSVPYHVEGSGVKYVEVYLDNVLVDESSYSDSKADATKSFAVSETGKHNIQIRAYVVNNSTKFYTDVLYYDFSVIGGSDTLFLIAATTTDLVESVSLTTTQYEELGFQWAIYSPKDQVVNVGFLLDGESLSSSTSTNGVVNDFVYVANESGSKTLTVNYANSTQEITINVGASSLNVSEATEGLIAKLSAKGRTNNENNPAVWEDNGITTTFNGFAWNETQGWNNGQLVISNGASIEVNIAPFDGDITSTGKSIELEFQTNAIIDANGTICECVNPLTGAGIVITPTSATLRSAGGSEVIERFKDNERIKICFIINRNSTVTDKQLMFIVTDGIHSRCASYSANDTFYGTNTLKFTSDAATIKLNTIRVYNRAITVDEELNNFMIDSDNLVELYSSNDIYEEGTNNVSVEKVSAHIPVLIFTGDIETLLAASDKNTSVRCDIEFINNQNPKYAFNVTNAKVKLQGTSSLGYPRKNFRFYTDETDICKIYNYAGELIEDGKFSFKEGAQPVTCWCLKADFAESSGSHNTGIARLWNNVMKNVKLNDEYVCRTQAQKAAVANNYEYDVRTTVDGYPIVCFYRQTATSELVFLGQYNFNNDKSTESVFGFCNIPGIDYTSEAEGNVQCWECLGNTNNIGLFKTVENFDSKWEEAFEARYPDLGGDAPTTDLKDFATWLVSTRHSDDVTYGSTITINGEVKADSDEQYGSESGYTANGSYTDNADNRQLKFEREKWDYMDVYKMAGYYIYLMRFGAVDQTVKNSMLTTEGTQGVGTHCKWFYINYDNDTINALVNNGRLLVAYDADRQTPSSLSAEEQDSAYEYAGHDSTLWNNLEADEEFMRIVRDLDNAMYSAGLTYKEVMNMFDNEQTDKWCERIYNSNGRYKYIQPYQESNTDYMFMLQGSRKSHRHWWLSNRFEIYDSKWITGSFLSQYVEFKVDNGAATEFTITSNKKLNYGYGVNAIVLQSGIELGIDESHTFDISDDGYTSLAIGDPVRIYGAPSLKSFELRNYQASLTDLNVSRAATGNTDCLLEGIYLGTESGTNSSLTAISGLNSITSLKELDIRGFKQLTELTLTDLPNLDVFLAANSGLTSFAPATGVNLSEVTLPSTLQVLSLNNATLGTFTYTPNATLRYVSLKNVNGIDTLGFVQTWVNAINSNANAELLLGQATLEASGLDWTTTAAELIEIGKIGNKTLTGKAYLTITPTVDEINALVEYFGTNCFDKDAAFIIDAPEGVTFVGKESFKSGNTVIYSLIEFPVEGGAGYTLSLYGVTSTIEDDKVVYVVDNVKFYPATGEMVTTESATDTSVTVRATNNLSALTYFDLAVTVEARTYPSVTISGDAAIRVAEQEYIYTAEYTPSEYDGTVSVEWGVGELYDGSIKLTWTNNSFYNTSNSVSTNDTMRYSDLVDVGNYSEIWLDVMVGSSYGINCYDAQQTFTESLNADSLELTGGEQYYKIKVEIPSDCVYVRVNTKIDSECNVYCQEHPTFTPSTNVSIVNSDNNTCVIKAVLVADEIQSETLVHTLTKIDGSVTTTTFDIAVTTQEIIMTTSSNPEVLAICYAQGWAANEAFMTAQEAAAVNDIGTSFKKTNITHFDEFEYFTGVTTCSQGAFQNCTLLTTIKLPTSLTALPNNFLGNTAISEIVVHGSCTSVSGYFSLGNCPNLKRVIFEEGVKNTASDTRAFSGSPVEYIQVPGTFTQTNSFINLTSLKEVHFTGDGWPKQMYFHSTELKEFTVGGDCTYQSIDGCLYSADGSTLVRVPSGLTTCDIKEGTTIIGEYAFYYNYINNVSIPDSLTTINVGCFGYSELSEFNFKNITTIGNCAFQFTKLKELYIPDTVTQIGANSPYNQHDIFTSSTIETVRWSSNCYYMQSRTFLNCSKLKEVTNIDHITTMYAAIFEGCSSLELFKIPASVQYIGGNQGYIMFDRCASLKGVVCLSDVPPTLHYNSAPYVFDNPLVPIYVPDDSVSAYREASYWSEWADRILPDSMGTELWITSNDSYAASSFYVLINYGYKFPYEEGVTWSITSGSEYASIDQDGKVTINESANGNVITVKAVSIYDETKYDEVDINVTYFDVIYNLQEETVFNNSNYIDTGLSLMQNDMDYTIYVRGVVDTYQQSDTIFHCMRESSPYPGIAFDCVSNSALRVVYMTNKTFNLSYTYGNEFELKLTHVAGTSVLSYEFTTNGTTTSGKQTNYSFTSITQTMLLGAYQTTSGGKGRYLDGTISEFYIKDYVEE